MQETISQDISQDILQETITIIADEFPKPFSITKWLVLSSCFFLIPATYALKNKIYIWRFKCEHNNLFNKSLAMC